MQEAMNVSIEDTLVWAVGVLIGMIKEKVITVKV